MADPAYDGVDGVLVGVHEGSQDCLVEVDMGGGDIRRLRVAPAQVYAVSYGTALARLFPLPDHVLTSSMFTLSHSAYLPALSR